MGYGWREDRKTINLLHSQVMSMKKLKLIYNPNAGDKSFRYDLDPCVKAFQEGGYETHVFRSSKHGDVAAHIARLSAESCDGVVICGGDGSVNLAVNAMMANKIDAPLGIIPSGTANDFANYLKMPGEHSEAAAAIARGNITTIDLGQANGQYFVNVCAAGMFSGISQNIDPNFKNTFGKLAYYAKGMEQLPAFTPMKIKIENSGRVIHETVHLFFALNSTGTGGFEHLSPGASITDGLLDFIAFKAVPMHEMALLFVRVLAGDYLSDPRVLFFRDRLIKITPTETAANKQSLLTDLDGELGPAMPVEIKNCHKAFRIFTP